MDEKEKYPSELAERFQVRLPEGLRDRIRSAADANNRSMNSEIVATLMEAYPPEKSFDELADAAKALLEEYRADMDWRRLTKLREVIEEVSHTLESLRTRHDEDDDPRG